MADGSVRKQIIKRLPFSILSESILLLALMVFSPLVCAGEHHHGKTVVIGTGEWPPYVASRAPGYGVMSQAVTAIFNAAGYKVKYDFEPWKRAKQMVKDGEQDVLMPAYCSKERARHYLCSNPVFTGRMVLFHRVSLPFSWHSIKDLEGYRIGATLGYFYGKSFDDAERAGKLHVVRIGSDETNMRLLMRGRIQLYPQDEAVGYAMIRQLFPKDQWHMITNAPNPLHTSPLCLLFTRVDPRGRHLMEVFNKGLANFRQDGRLKQMLDKLHHPKKLLEKIGAGGPPKAKP